MCQKRVFGAMFSEFSIKYKIELTRRQFHYFRLVKNVNSNNRTPSDFFSYFVAPGLLREGWHSLVLSEHWG